jgi:hypothetical protein
VLVIDPEGEYAPIVEALGGSVVSMRPGSPVSLDAFAVADDQPGALSSQVATLVSMFGLLAGGLSATQRAAVEEALTFTYAVHGYTDDGARPVCRPPTLVEVDAALERIAARSERGTTADIEQLRLQLVRYVRGSGRWLFAPGPNPPAAAPLAAYVLAGLPEDERVPAMFLVSGWSRRRASGGPG